MVAKRGLRSVSDDEKPPVESNSKSVTEAAMSGTTRDLLVATRDRIAVAVENPNTPARDLASLSKQLMETVREIESIDARSKEAESHANVEDGEFDASAV